MRFLVTIALAAAIVVLLGGCKTLTRSRSRLEWASATNTAALTEESRALTTGALDSLGRVQGTNSTPPVDLARRLLIRDQAIEGLPVNRIDVDAVLAGHKQAIQKLEDRLDGVDELISERQRLATQLEETQRRLADLGEKYEAERSKTIWRRIFSWFGITGSIAALLALVVFFPPALIIITRIVGLVVGRLPQLASVFGVVTTGAFRSVVTAVEKAREVIRVDHGPAAEEKVLTAMSKSMDRPEKDLVKIAKVGVKPV